MKVMPAPCEFQDSTISIATAVQLLADKQLSYLLLLGSEGRVSGIFTKTDFVNAAEKLFEDPSLILEPVHKIMTRKIKSLALDKIHEAPEFMLKNRLEHVPITFENDGEETIIGIVTAESVFEFMVRLRGIPPIFGGETARREHRNIGVLSPDGSLFQTMKVVFSRSHYINVERYKFSGFDLLSAAKNIDVLLIDIDDIESRKWLPIVKDASEHPGLENVFVVHSPEKHENVRPLLKDFEISGVLHLYEKPFDLSKISVDLEKIWANIFD